jgi:hypothetical protein
MLENVRDRTGDGARLAGLRVGEALALSAEDVDVALPTARSGRETTVGARRRGEGLTADEMGRWTH